MSDPEQQKKLLAVLLVMLVGFAGYRVIQLTGGEGRREPVRSVPIRRGRVLAELEVPHLDLESLRREAATYTPGRDPFRFGAAPNHPQPEPAAPQADARSPGPSPQARAVPAATPAKPPAR